MVTNSLYSQYCKYLKHLLEVECAEKNLSFDSLFISYIKPQSISNQELFQKQEEKELIEREKFEKEEALKRELDDKKRKDALRQQEIENQLTEQKLREEAKKKELEEINKKEKLNKPKRGDLEFEDGYYIGDTKKGLMHGHGTRYWDENDKVWAGEWADGKAYGHIVVSFGNFIAYDGQMENGLPNGLGIYTDINNGQRYEGNFVDFKREGEGTLYTENGDKIYEGEWKNNKYHGYGMYFMRGQCRYDGLWENGKRNGDGVAYDEKGIEEYNGPWKDDVRLNDIDRIQEASKG
ncbi:hypothetical protein NLB58_02145 [Porphyromonas gingivalis]|uniref:MORN repeat-containing protein n=1 Tax=Porphyromonas gingivalis TaxID=837 RepID=UPI00265B35EB|nr:hypothetical protein [Porphyromonas gingivalis]MDP0530677.1 hypothetical protein [Porphyromonas gingivalis]MDP0625637.1 hypothetical protein [Porphyromonas gingivalis]WKD51740.1 hypothetical protein NF669_05495 [Porphyromonas gingivalis]WKD53788.1 hypothetical protein NF668_05500 [Porphyromonas gingivalis]